MKQQSGLTTNEGGVNEGQDHRRVEEPEPDVSGNAGGGSTADGAGNGLGVETPEILRGEHAEAPSVGHDEESNPSAGDETRLNDGLVVEVPPRRPGQPPLLIELPDKDSADVVRGLVRDGMRRDHFNRAMENVKLYIEELDVAAQQLEASPLGFLKDYRFLNGYRSRLLGGGGDRPELREEERPKLPPRTVKARRVS